MSLHGFQEETGEKVAPLDADEASRPECFGDPAKVCPKDEEGFTQPRKECLSCGWVRPCLQAGLRAQGTLPPTLSQKFRASPVGGFLERWSRRKLGGK